MSFAWFPFPKDWPAWFRERTGKPHCRANVNSQCAYVADLYRQYLGRGTNQYGFYHGPMPHPFWRSHALARHGWLLLTDDAGGEIIYDPTRWCFYPGNKPRLAIVSADCTDYDQGMNRVRAALNGDYYAQIPEFDPASAVACDQPDITALFRNRVCFKRLLWLANLPPQHATFSSKAERIRMILWLQNNGHRALIPQDNRV